MTQTPVRYHNYRESNKRKNEINEKESYMKNSLAISLLMDLYQKEVILGTEETLNNLLQYLSAKTFLNDRILESFYLLKYFSFTKLENTCKN